METALTKPANPVELLTAPEREAYERFLRSDKAHIGPALAANLFESFLNGRTLQEIHRDNDELNFGSIVAARIEYGWDAARADHMRRLLTQAADRALRSQLEAVDFLFDMFQITHLLNKDKFEEFRRTRNPAALKDAIKIESIKQYGDLVRALTTLLEKSQTLTTLVQNQTEPKDDSVPTTAQPAAPGALPAPTSFLARTAAQRREEQAAERQERDADAQKRAQKKPPEKPEREEDAA